MYIEPLRIYMINVDSPRKMILEIIFEASCRLFRIVVAFAVLFLVLPNPYENSNIRCNPRP